MRVFLVGPMGAGKSTVGRRLATLMHHEFVDCDAEIERQAGADISWIFDVEGEAGFRDREQQVLQAIATRDDVVIATGGGAVVREANRRCMRAAGTVVYLHAAVAEQVRRTHKDTKRPLLNVDDPKQVLADLMAVREPLYRGIADVVVTAEGDNASKVAARLRAELSSIGRNANEEKHE